MSIFESSSEVQDSSSFDIVKELFAESEAEVASHASTAKSSPTVLQLEEQESVETEDDKISETSSIFRQRLRRLSSVKRDSLILESFRKRSGIPEHESVETILESRSSSHCSPVTLKYLEDQHENLLSKYNTSLEAAHDKLLKLGTMTVDKNRKPKPTLVIESLLNQMTTTRSILSKNRRKLLSNFQRLDHLNVRDALLDLQIKNIRLEELHDLQVEVSRTTEKIDETSKQMAKARQQYESDISKAAHVREKWFAFQNKILTKVDDLNELKVAIQEHREYLCGLLERKKQLREENAELRKGCRIIENKPLLRKYDSVVEEVCLTVDSCFVNR
ncbi:uncharacterized protein LOC110676763 [Aedes aegypti]|uniref:CCDC113/CCDC96 coiled-coil domain-containing protein n=1 Tax=Aedes aegypti TaxID=7159 RepID=A0A6I8U0H7_AEDAE|nr:uncharacterized protein LOC110676763 [Aedes aegypti]